MDILLFNPPYVPTESDEVCGTGIEASWAGGVDGREVIDRFIPLLNVSDRFISQSIVAVVTS